MTERHGRVIWGGMSSSRVLSLLTVAIAITVAAAPAPASEGLRPAVERVVDAGAPGAVAIGGGRTAAAGVADVRTGPPLRPGARVRIGSITKSFTAVVAFQLVGAHDGSSSPPSEPPARRSGQRLHQHAMSVGADHEVRPGTPFVVLVKVPRHLHPLHGFAAVVTGR